MNSRSGSSRNCPSASGASLRSAMQPQREPHQRAERGFERPEVNRGDAEEEQFERNHAAGGSERAALLFPSGSPQAALTAELPLHAVHEPVIALMIVPQEMQEAVQRQHAILGARGDPRRAPGGAQPLGYGDIPESGPRGPRDAT